MKTQLDQQRSADPGPAEGIAPLNSGGGLPSTVASETNTCAGTWLLEDLLRAKEAATRIQPIQVSAPANIDVDLQIIAEVGETIIYRDPQGRIIIGLESDGRAGGDLVGATGSWQERPEAGRSGWSDS